MLVANLSACSSRVLARDIDRGSGPFKCPICGNEVILRKGQVRIHHFAHRAKLSCTHGAGESDQHRRAKEELFEAMKNEPGVEQCELECVLNGVVADVYFEWNGARIALEVQRSTLSPDELEHRTRQYEQNGIYVLWLPLFHSKLKDQRYSPKLWEKWLHAAYFGRVYYWVAGKTIQPVHFDPFELVVPESSWHGAGGEESYAGGYSKTSKRFRAPRFGEPVELMREFRTKERDAWSSGALRIPRAKFLMDVQSKWW